MKKEIRLLFNLNNEESFIEQDGQIDWQSLSFGDIARITFPGVSFVTPFCLLGLLIRCRQCFERTSNRVIISELSDEVYKYLQRMQFFQVAADWVELEGDYSLITPWDKSPLSLNLIEITNINEDMDLGSEDVIKMAQLFREREKEILSLWLGKDDIETNDFVTVLSEIAQNIFEWSGNNGYVALNRYSYNSENKYVLRLSIIDGGRGLNTTVMKKIGKKKYQHTSDYLCHPFEYSLSRSKGGGLFKVFDFIKQWNGKLFVRSGDSYVYKSRNKISFEKFDNAPIFYGTHISIELESKIS